MASSSRSIAACRRPGGRSSRTIRTGRIYEALVTVAQRGFLREPRIAAHELLHAIGLGHTRAWTSVMGPNTGANNVAVRGRRGLRAALLRDRPGCSGSARRRSGSSRQADSGSSAKEGARVSSERQTRFSSASVIPSGSARPEERQRRTGQSRGVPATNGSGSPFGFLVVSSGDQELSQQQRPRQLQLRELHQDARDDREDVAGLTGFGSRAGFAPQRAPVFGTSRSGGFRSVPSGCSNRLYPVNR